jgi:hypothetical protein
VAVEVTVVEIVVVVAVVVIAVAVDSIDAIIEVVAPDVVVTVSIDSHEELIDEVLVDSSAKAVTKVLNCEYKLLDGRDDVDIGSICCNDDIFSVFCVSKDKMLINASVVIRLEMALVKKFEITDDASSCSFACVLDIVNVLNVVGIADNVLDDVVEILEVILMI